MSISLYAALNGYAYVRTCTALGDAKSKPDIASKAHEANLAWRSRKSSPHSSPEGWVVRNTERVASRQDPTIKKLRQIDFT